MINMFRTVLLNLDPVVANGNPALTGYMVVDDAYTVKDLSNPNLRIFEVLFVNATTTDAKIARATTIHKIVANSMLYPILTKHDSRITGLYSKEEVSTDAVTQIMDAIAAATLDRTSYLFSGTPDKNLYAEHAFYRSEPLENIIGLAIATVEDVIEKRNLKWL